MKIVSALRAHADGLWKAKHTAIPAKAPAVMLAASEKLGGSPSYLQRVLVRDLFIGEERVDHGGVGATHTRIPPLRPLSGQGARLVRPCARAVAQEYPDWKCSCGGDIDIITARGFCD